MNTRTRTAAASGIQIEKDIHADVDTTDIDLDTHDKSIELDSTMSIEDLRDALNAGGGDVDAPDFKNLVDTLAYMEEKVLVRVLPSAEPHAEKIIEVWNGGTPQRFIRDEWVVARRKYVEVLARAMPYSVTTPEGTDGRGDKTRRIDIHNGQRFPFEMKDPNNASKGAAWLRGIYMEKN